MPLYLRKLPAVFGDVPIRDLGYMASEGRGATPLVNSGAAGVLNVTSHFFEFVPEEQRDDPNADVPHLRRARVEPRVLHLLHDLGRPVPLRHQRRRPGRRLLPQHAGDPVRPQGPGDDLDHRREADRVAGDRARCSRWSSRAATTCSTSRPASQWGEPPRYALYAELGDSMTTERSREFLARVRPVALRAEHRVRGEARVDAAGRAGAEARRARLLPGAAPEARRRGRARGAGEDPAALDRHGVRRRARRARGGEPRWLSHRSPQRRRRDRADARAACRCSAHLSERQRARLARFATTRSYKQGSTIVRQGDTSMSLYVVLSGAVRVNRESEGGGGAVEVERARARRRLRRDGPDRGPAARGDRGRGASRRRARCSRSGTSRTSCATTPRSRSRSCRC